MTTVVVGGHSRNVGKTSVAVGVIRAFRRYPWTAVKISTHWHDAPRTGDVCVIHEERIRGERSDSERYLAAGAARSFWIRVREEQMASAMQVILPILHSNPLVIIESNCILEYLRPDLSIMVLRYDVAEFKDSAREALRCAQAAIAIGSESRSFSWGDFVSESLIEIPLFTTPDPEILPDGFLEFVKLHLRLHDIKSKMQD